MARAASFDPKAALIGTWRSDKNLTLSEWRFPAGREAEGRAALERDFGKLVRRFTPHQYVSEFEGLRSRAGYRVVWHNKESVFIVHGPKTSETGELIHFMAPDLFRVNVGGNAEYFRRLAPNNSSKPTPLRGAA